MGTCTLVEVTEAKPFTKLASRAKGILLSVCRRVCVSVCARANICWPASTGSYRPQRGVKGDEQLPPALESIPAGMQGISRKTRGCCSVAGNSSFAAASALCLAQAPLLSRYL